MEGILKKVVKEVKEFLVYEIKIIVEEVILVKNFVKSEIKIIVEEKKLLGLWLGVYGTVAIFYSNILDFVWHLKSFKNKLLPGGGNYEDLFYQFYFYDGYGLVGFQTPKSENMSNLIATHNQIFGYCVFVVLFVFFFLVVTLVYYTVSNEENKSKYPYERVESKMERMSKLYEGIKTPKDELFFYDHYFLVVESEGTLLDRAPLKRDFRTFISFNSLTKKEEKNYGKALIFGKILKGLKVKSQVIVEKKWIKTMAKLPLRVTLWYNKENLKKIKVDQTSRARRKFWDNLVVETVWTLVPSFILIAIALPSFFFLYSLSPDLFYDENTVFLKVIGHQWYWSYEFPRESFAILQKPVEQSFSSYMLPTSELKEEMPRLLTVDNPVYLPTKTNIVIRVTSEDVIHSWAIPSLGVKLDCIPGRINEFVFKIESAGTLYGQCSELCGVNHGFMPIHVIAYENA